MKIIYVNQYIFTHFLIIFHASKAATHWIVTEDGKIHTQEDSIFQMRRPYDLMSFLQQEKRADVFSKIKSQLMAQKEEIESENFDNQEDVEQLVYLTNSDCLKAGKPLVQFDLYVGTMMFAYPRNDRRALPSQFPVGMFRRNNHQLDSKSPLSGLNDLYYDPGNNKNWITFSSSNTSSKAAFKDSNESLDSNFDEDGNENLEDYSTENVDKSARKKDLKRVPDCSEYPLSDFSMTSFEHLPSVRSRKNLKMDPEPEILRYIGKWKSYQSFGKDIYDGLKQNSSSWTLYTLASFYWRGLGQAEQAIECVRRALHSSPYEYRPIPLLSLATILHRARSYDEAVIVLHGVIDMAPEIPHSHYTLANIYTVMTDYNKSVICLENVSRLCPNFLEAKLRKHAVLCHNNIENALKAQHENLQKTLDELKDYQRQQELWINYHQKLRSEQAPPSVQLEQRLHYREFKIRQKLEDGNFLKDSDNNKENSINNNNNNKQNQKSSTTNSINDDPMTVATLNHIQMKLEEHGKKLIDLYIELEEHEKAYEENQIKRKSQETNEEIHERSNRIKKLLAATTGNNNEMNDSSDQPKTSNNANNKNENDSTDKADTAEDENNISENTPEECSPNSRPMLIPVTFVLPPSN